jgi:hypothetical protein
MEASGKRYDPSLQLDLTLICDKTLHLGIGHNQIIDHNQKIKEVLYEEK